MASGARFACAREVFAADHGDLRLSRTLRPLSRPRRVRCTPLPSPVPLVGHTVARRALTDHASELLAAGNGEPLWLPLFPAGALSLSLPSLIGAIRPRSNGLGWPIPFRRGKFVKEPLPFPEIEPVVQGVVPRMRNLVWKA